MGFFDWLAPPATTAPPAAAVVAEPVFSLATPVAVAGETSDPSIESMTRAERVALNIANSIPSVRRANHVIAGTIGTFALAAWDEHHNRIDPRDPRVSWLAQPEVRHTRQRTLTRSVLDVVWRGRCIWRPVDRTLLGSVTAIERIHPERIDTVAHAFDPDRVEKWIIDGDVVSESSLVVFDGAGLGGLDRFGYDLLTIYGQLQAAAGRYAKAPHPHAILKNHGEDLEPDEITALLDQWEKARETRSIGYLNEVMDYEVKTGTWSAREVQLVEAREHAATEVARLMGLPSWALDAKSGDSMTYGNVVDRRRDLLEALRPWMAVFEQTISLDDRTGRPHGILLPRGITATFDVDAYTRDDPKTRIETGAAAIAAGILTVDEVRNSEPLTRY